LRTFEQSLPTFFAGALCRPFLLAFADLCWLLPTREAFANVCDGICRPLPPFNFGSLLQQLTAYVKANLFCRPFLGAFADICQPMPTFSTQQLPAYIEALLAFANLLLPTFKLAFADSYCQPL
jgi:hypothetical protein